MNNIKQEKQFSMELIVDSFETRLKKLLGPGKKVIYIKNEFDNSTFRYRAYNIAQAMDSQKKYTITYFLSEELHFITKYINNIDILILQRASWNISLENFVYIVKYNNIPVIYDIDDLIISPEYVPLYLNNLGSIDNDIPLSDAIFTMVSKYYAIACKCDGFITTNEYLANYIKKDFHKPVWTISNFLNREQEKHSKIVREKENRDTNKFIMGYFSGTPSHRLDLQVITNDISRLLEKYNDIFFVIVGYMNIPKELSKYKNRIIQRPFVSYEGLQYEIGEVDLNLIPLQNNIFNNCKSELKFFEAGIVNVISCCSPTYVYKKLIINGENGYLCKNGDWFGIIEQIYKNRKNLQEVKKNAYNTSISLYGVNNQSKKITSCYDKILKNFNIKYYKNNNSTINKMINRCLEK